MGLKCYFALLCTALAAAQHTAPQEPPLPSENIDQGMLEAKQASMLREDFEKNFNPWVVEELTATQQNSYFEATEGFLLQLDPDQRHEFSWATSPRLKHPRLKVRVFTQESGDDIVIIKNPEQHSRVEVALSSSIAEQYTPIANVYLQKVLTMGRQGKSALIELRNTHSVRVIVQVSLEGEAAVINPSAVARNAHLEVPAMKLEALLSEMRVTESSRKRQYKWEWGFLEREQHYEEEMLKLVGAETVIILATAVVQMCCIRGLLHHTPVV